MQPLIRHRIGEKIYDPVYENRYFEKFKDEVRKPIRIYYVPVSVRDLGKRDCLSWCVLHAVSTVAKTASAISTWLKPEKYYISWPYCYYDPSIVRDYRKDFLKSNVALSCGDGDVTDGLQLGFTLTEEQADSLRDEVKVKSTGLWANPQTRDARLPLHERFSYKNFSISDVFDSLKAEKYENKLIKEYYNLDSWQNYCNFLSKLPELERPEVIKYFEWNEIGYEEK